MKQNNKKMIDVLISGSVGLIDEWQGIITELTKRGFSVEQPEKSSFDWGSSNQEACDKQRKLLFLQHFNKMKQARCLLVFNGAKNGTLSHIGASAMIEIGMAYALGIPIFAYYDLRDDQNDLRGTGVICLNEKLDKMIGFLKESVYEQASN